ncbi:VWA domain-containing protein [Thermoanaerobacterium sp. RBIITD]|uniref:vWA domain-containing protein n=1 Tax=Thermoanaerobacterium sp. RBIITD TaxID=1550240 RepID=UPI000BB8B31E|nr:VWA domain-containing protein [Thermoanaerobacterium sp. RBIITD]SNX54287.1 Ca-activated chloride channel family protein [Thermoanaerobacterium sp. RBIITD]
MSEVLLKQIVVITDGQSNVGGNPAIAALYARQKGITVSAIGIVDDENISEKEIKAIANNGGGIYDIIYSDKLIKSLTMVTQKSIEMTLSKTINNELRSIIGKSIEELHPALRTQIIDFIENLSDTLDLRCVILLDLSGSMCNKLKKAKGSIKDLLNTFKVRKGKSEIGLIGFPGENGDYTRVVCPFTSNAFDIELSLNNIKPGGNTPTAPAIERATSLFKKEIFSIRHIV